jgi:hypothetical protein
MLCILPAAAAVHVSYHREEKEKLSKPCKAEVFKVQKVIATDYRADPEMAALCKTDIEQHCKGVKDGGGRVTACLVRGRSSSSRKATACLAAG